MANITGWTKKVEGIDISSTGIFFETADFFGFPYLLFDVRLRSGAWSTGVIKLEMSTDTEVWYDAQTAGLVSGFITGAGCIADANPCRAKYMRLNVTTANLTSCIVDIIIQGTAT